MKVRNILLPLPFLLLLISSSVFALSPQTNSHTIRSIEVDTRFSPPQVQVYLNETIMEREGCRNWHRLAFSYDDGGKAMLSLLLSAKAVGSSVRFNLDGCQDSVPKVKITVLE